MLRGLQLRQRLVDVVDSLGVDLLVLERELLRDESSAPLPIILRDVLQELRVLLLPPSLVGSDLFRDELIQVLVRDVLLVLRVILLPQRLVEGEPLLSGTPIEL